MLRCYATFSIILSSQPYRPGNLLCHIDPRMLVTLCVHKIGDRLGILIDLIGHVILPR